MVADELLTNGLNFQQVGINPAFQAPEAEYALNKAGVKALIMTEQHFTQNYYDMTAQIVPELKTSSPGQLNSTRVPSLRTVVVDTENGSILP